MVMIGPIPVMTYRLPESLQTERYHVRRVRLADAEVIFEAYAADPEVTKYLTWPTHSDVSETRLYVERVVQEWDSGVGYPAVIESLANPKRLLGMIHPHLAGSRVSYGYVIRRDHWGQGCASEVLRALADHALANPDIYRAQAFCDVENVGSARVMEKAGMELEGKLRRYSLHPTEKAPRDCFMYARVR